MEPNLIHPQVKRGDRLLLVREGQDLSCRITGFDAEFVYGCKYPVALRDISEVRFRKLDGKNMFTLPDLRPGDEVTVHLVNGDARRFLFVAVDGGSIRGEHDEVLISQVDRAEVVRNPLKPGSRGILSGVAAAADAGS